MKIGIIGTGAFSISIAMFLAQKKSNKIILWSENKKLTDEVKKTKKLPSIFPDLKLPTNITITNDYQKAIDDKDLIFLMTNISYLEKICKDLKPLINKKIPLIIGTKGMLNTPLLVHQIVKKHLKNPVAVMSGPTFAEDVLNLEPIGLCLASKKRKIKQLFKTLFSDLTIKITYTSDINSVALCGCLKNIYAIGSGILNGLNYHESTNALYLTKVYQELDNILFDYGNDYKVISNLAGLGDLILTCSSNKSRNYTYGTMLGRKTSKKELNNYLKTNTIEGLNSLNSILELLKKAEIKAPIITTIYKIVNENQDANTLITTIMEKERIF